MLLALHAFKHDCTLVHSQIGVLAMAFGTGTHGHHAHMLEALYQHLSRHIPMFTCTDDPQSARARTHADCNPKKTSSEFGTHTHTHAHAGAQGMQRVGADAVHRVASGDASAVLEDAPAAVPLPAVEHCRQNEAV